MLREAAGIDERDGPEEAQRKISELLGDEGDAVLVGERLATLLRASPDTPGIQETFWAVRKLFEHLGAKRPLVVVFDDIQWGEATFLDLLEYLADWMRTAPVLFLLSRPSGAPRGRPRLDEHEAKRDARSRSSRCGRRDQPAHPQPSGGAEFTGEARIRIAELAEGNPLFVEETLRMLIDDGILRRVDGKWQVDRGSRGSGDPADDQCASRPPGSNGWTRRNAP